MDLLTYALLGGVFYGLYFALVGLGLNLIFGVMRIINLAHGYVLMLGAYGAFYVYSLLGVTPLWSIPMEFVAWLALGIPLYYLVVPRLLRSRDPEMLSFMLFFGVAQAVEAAAVFGFSNNQRSIPGSVFSLHPFQLAGQAFPASWVASAAAGVLGIAGVYLYLYRTRLGYATRAVMLNRDEASAAGVNTHGVSAIAFGVGLALASLAGVFAPFMMGSIQPSMGGPITVVSFAIIVIGGLGNPVGTLAGGLVYGLSLMLMQTYLPSWSTLLPYVLLILILLARPSGLLSRSTRHA